GLAVLFGSTALVAPSFAQAPTGAIPAPAPPAPPAAATAAQPPAPAPGGAPPAPALAAAQSGVVQRIDVQGNERIETETIVSYLPIQVGDTITPQQIDLAIKTLFRTDLFSDVSIELQNGDLIVRVVENPIINQVVFEGNDNMKDDKLRDEV